MTRLTPAIGAFLLFLPTFVLSQDTLKGWTNFQIECDLSRFYGDTNHVFVEIYYGIRENALTYKRESGRYAGAADVKYVIRNDTGVVATREWTVPHTFEDSS